MDKSQEILSPDPEVFGYRALLRDKTQSVFFVLVALLVTLIVLALWAFFYELYGLDYIRSYLIVYRIPKWTVKSARKRVLEYGK